MRVDKDVDERMNGFGHPRGRPLSKKQNNFFSNWCTHSRPTRWGRRRKAGGMGTITMVPGTWDKRKPVGA